MTSTHYTRRCSTSAAMVVTLAVMVAPALTPAALAYDAKASAPADSARLLLPDWDALAGCIDPFDGNLIPRRAMEHPRQDGGNESMGLECRFRKQVETEARLAMIAACGTAKKNPALAWTCIAATANWGAA